MSARIMSPEIARAQRREQQDAILQALGHPAGRAFLTARLEAETSRLRHRPGETHADVTHQLGRVEMLRDLVNELARASQPNPRTGD
jgi:hypothetical protein